MADWRSKKMYKTRFNAWGLRKHNRRHEVEKMLKIKDAREKQGKQSAFILQGREVDMDDLERYRKRHKVQIHTNPRDDRSGSEEMNDLVILTPSESPNPSSGSSTFDSSSSSDLDSSISTFPMLLAVPPPTILGYREDFMRGISIGFELMIKTKTWNISTEPEMLWNPVMVHAVSDPVLSEPTIPEYYYQDECFRHLSTGVNYIKQGSITVAYKEWTSAFVMVQHVIQSKHYNMIGKLLECVYYLNQREHQLVAESFRRYVCKMAQKVLGPDHPYFPVFVSLEHLPLDDISELQMNTQDCLVNGLERFLGPQAFTSFEHKMVLAQRKLEADPFRRIDDLMPSDSSVSTIYGTTSSKSFLALNLRYRVLRTRGLLVEAQQVCLAIVEKATLVNDPALQRWHLTSALVNLARIQHDLGEFHPMRISLKNALDAEGELRNNYGMIKLGEGELHWICEKLGIEPQFRDDVVDETEMRLP